MTDTVDTIGTAYVEGRITIGQAEARLLALNIPPLRIGELMAEYRDQKRDYLRSKGPC